MVVFKFKNQKFEIKNMDITSEDIKDKELLQDLLFTYKRCLILGEIYAYDGVEIEYGF